jgi:glucokinase
VTVRIGVDVGGTKSAAGVVSDAGLIGPVITVPTRVSSPQDHLTGIVELVRAVAGTTQEPISAVGLGIAGLVDHEAGMVRFAPHLPLRDEPVADLLSQSLGLDVGLENDATAAAWAEFLLGAGRGARNLLMVSVGTGIGGGIVINGRVLRGSSGMAGEIGHVPFVPNGELCGCGSRGCWEQYASGNALGRRARDAAIAHPARAHAIVASGGGDVSAISGRDVAVALEQGDQLALELITEVGRDLGEGVAGLVAVLDPDVVVIGGGLAVHGETLLGPAQAALSKRLIGAGHRPIRELQLAALGPHAALIGAALAVGIA